MAQAKILLDSNAYFRLAKDIHPLLFRPFGDESHCLYVLKDLQDEYDRSRRLQSKFPWVDDADYKTNRSKPLTLSRKQKSDISVVEDFMWDAVQTELLGPSRIDVRNLAYAYTLDISLVTDDIDLRQLAGMFDVPVMSTLELLKLMLDCRHINIEDIRRIAGYWSWLGDRPGGFTKEYRKLFREAPPP